MTEESRRESNVALSTDDDPRQPTWEIATLEDGGKEPLIDHGGQIYRLRITANQKLILTKVSLR